jgi:hypothetical protein
MASLRSGLDVDGAVSVTTVTLTEVEESSITKAGLPVPTPFTTTALFDTGASRTAVAPSIISHLGAARRGFDTVLAPNGNPVKLPLYNLRISPGNLKPAFYVQAVAVMPASPTVLVLIGRDILDQCRFVYDGLQNTFSLAF